MASLLDKTTGDVRTARSFTGDDPTMTMRTADNVTDLRLVLRQISPAVAAEEAAVDKQRFEFYFYVTIVGSLCLFGFAANTIAMLLVRKHRSSLLRCVRVDRLTADFDILLQATVVADVLLLWTVFLGHVVPSLAYVIPLLRQCEVTCRHLAAVHRPLSALTKVLVVWLSTATVACGEVVAGVEIVASRRRTSEIPTVASATTTGHSTLKTKLIILLLVLVAAVYVAPMTFDNSLRIASSASPVDGATTATLTDHALYRLLYVNASSLFVIVVPLVCLLGLAISLPTIGRALGRSAADSHRGQFGSQFLVQSPMQQASNGGGGLIDVINIATMLTLLLFLAYIPQVALLVIRWIGVDQVNTEYVSILSYADAAGLLFVTVNSATKLPAFCLASAQYRAFLRRLCCQRTTRPSSIGQAIRIYHEQKQQQQRQQRRRRKRSQKDGPEATDPPSTVITLILPPSEINNPPSCIINGCPERQTLSRARRDGGVDEADAVCTPSTD